MTLVKVNNRPAFKSWNGIVQELFNDLEKSLQTPAVSTYASPAVNIIENPEGFHLELLAPGCKKEGFDLNIEKNQITISYKGEKQEAPADQKLIRREFAVNDFKRTFMLNESIDADNIQAKYEDGILKLLFPKKEELKPAPRTIEVQ